MRIKDILNCENSYESLLLLELFLTFFFMVFFIVRQNLIVMVTLIWKFTGFLNQISVTFLEN